MRRIVVHACVAALCAVMAQGQPVAAQLPRPKFLARSQASVERAVQWVDAAVHHQPGVLDSRIAALATWDADAVSGIVIEASTIRSLMRGPRSYAFQAPDTGIGVPTDLGYSGTALETLRAAARTAAAAGLDGDDLLARGIVLHTDAALLGNAAGTVLNFSDGRSLGLQRQGDHWTAARTLATWLDAGRGRKADVRFWYRASLAAMAAADMWNARHADAAAALRPPDPDLLFLAGAVHETLASTRVQASVAGVRMPVNVSLVVKTSGEELRQAAPLLKRAIELSPDHIDARIHYGRVLTLMNRPADAIADLQRASDNTTDLLQRYYARLFLGAAFDAANRRDEARGAYEGAAALFPRAQSPRLALSELAARTGDRAAALSAVAPLTSPAVEDEGRGDPWWDYPRSAGRDADALMTKARARLWSTHAEAPRR